MPRNRRNKRGMKPISEVLETRTFIKISIIFIAIIGICLAIIMIKNYNKQIEIAKQREMLEQKIAAIFEDYSYEKEEETNNSIKLDTTAKISIVGDILCSDAMIVDAEDGNTYNFDHMFENMKNILNNSDITVGTMETNFTDDKFSDYGKCNSPKEFAQAVKNSSVDLVSIAHNHALDYGVDGLTKTKEYLTELGYITVGASTSEEDRYVIKEINGIKIAFLAYTYGFNNEKSLKDEEKKCVNTFKEEEVKADLESANAEADFIFVMMHWGEIYSNNVSEEQSKIAQFLVDNGANTIVGAHPAVVEPMEVIQNSKGENVFIAYSVGNYISNLGYENSNLEMILDVQIRKDGETGKVTLEKVTYTPVYMVDNGTKVKNRFELVNMREIAKEYANGNKDIINEKLYNKLIKGLERLEEIIRNV